MISVIFFNAEFAIDIFLVNYLLYLIANVIEYAIAMALYWETVREDDFRLIPYLPLMPLYVGIFMRIVRTYAQLMELLHNASFYDAWNPWKVSKIAKEEKL